MTASAVEREVFVNGWYAAQFRPDDPADPFRSLYAVKRHDVLAAFAGDRGPARILDLGGGMGRVAVPLARRHRVTLCDISEEMLAMAREAAERAEVPPGHLLARRVDASAPLPFATASFEHAIALDLLVHLSDPVATLRELHRVIAPGGRLIVDTTNRSPWWTLRYPRYVGRHPRRWVNTLRGGGVLPEWQRIVRHHSAAEFARMVAAAGFVVVEERRYGPRACPKWFLRLCVRP